MLSNALVLDDFESLTKRLDQWVDFYVQFFWINFLFMLNSMNNKKICSNLSFGWCNRGYMWWINYIFHLQSYHVYKITFSKKNNVLFNNKVIRIRIKNNLSKKHNDSNKKEALSKQINILCHHNIRKTFRFLSHNRSVSIIAFSRVNGCNFDSPTFFGAIFLIKSRDFGTKSLVNDGHSYPTGCRTFIRTWRHLRTRSCP